MIKEKPKIEVEVTFTRTENGGRNSPVRLTGGYRSHLVLESPHPTLAEKNQAAFQEPTYVGVEFVSDSTDMAQLGIPVKSNVIFLFYPHPAYDAFLPGRNFTVREGSKIVGYGKVLKIL